MRRPRLWGAVVLGCAVTLAAPGALSAASPATGYAGGHPVVADEPAPGTPHVMDGAVLGITQVGRRIVAVGNFTRVSPAATFDKRRDDLTRRGVFAFDATTGKIDRDFRPQLRGTAYAVDTDGTHLYVVGDFRGAAGHPAIRGVVKLTARGKVVGGFRATPDATVRDVAVRGRRVYVGGAFTRIARGGTSVRRSALAALDRRTGRVLGSVRVPFAGVHDPSQPDPGRTGIIRFDASADGRRLVAVGNFSRVGGRPRAQVAVLDTGGQRARVTRWSSPRFHRRANDCLPGFDAWVRDVDLSPDGSWFVVTTTGGFAGGARTGTLCDTSSRWQTAGRGHRPVWVSYTGGDTTYGVAVTPGAVYVGGHMRWQNNPFQVNQAGPGAVRRPGIAALDPANGLPLSWNPRKQRGVGAQALHTTPQGLWVGSDTTRIAGELRGRIALMPYAGGTVVPTVAPASLPADLFVARRGRDELLRRPVDAGGRPAGMPSVVEGPVDWSSVRGAFLVDGRLYYGRVGGGLHRRSFDPVTGALGPRHPVDLREDPQDGRRIRFPTGRLTGMFLDPHRHRLYYTLRDDGRLFYRYFTPESEVVGAQTFTAPAGRLPVRRVAGMTLADGRILYGDRAGGLRSVRFAQGRVSGAPRTLSSDGTWRARALFVPNG